MIEIIFNPSEKQINTDLKKADCVLMVYGLREEREIREMIVKFKEEMKFNTTYCHYYSADNVYTLGIKILK